MTLQINCGKISSWLGLVSMNWHQSIIVPSGMSLFKYFRVTASHQEFIATLSKFNSKFVRTLVHLESMVSAHVTNLNSWYIHSGDENAFQSNTNHPLSDSPCFIVNNCGEGGAHTVKSKLNKLDHVWGIVGRRQDRVPVQRDGLGPWSS